jgi:hypothetical protein
MPLGAVPLAPSQQEGDGWLIVTGDAGTRDSVVLVCEAFRDFLTTIPLSGQASFLGVFEAWSALLPFMRRSMSQTIRIGVSWFAPVYDLLLARVDGLPPIEQWAVADGITESFDPDCNDHFYSTPISLADTCAMAAKTLRATVQGEHPEGRAETDSISFEADDQQKKNASKSKKKRGRPQHHNTEKDEKLVRRWEAVTRERRITYEQFDDEQGLHSGTIKNAIDRHRKREKRRKK